LTLAAIAKDLTWTERFSGLMLPLIKGSPPDFGPVFKRYANDLKHGGTNQRIGTDVKARSRPCEEVN
jgi:hypothetical protein